MHTYAHTHTNVCLYTTDGWRDSCRIMILCRTMILNMYMHTHVHTHTSIYLYTLMEGEICVGP